jgi:hypothetical protein
MSSAPIVTVLVDTGPIEVDEQLAKFAQFWGLRVSIIRWSEFAQNSQHQTHARIYAVRAEILPIVCEDPAWHALEQASLGVLVYGLNSEDSPSDAMRGLFPTPVLVETLPPATRRLGVCGGLGIAAFADSGVDCEIEFESIDVFSSCEVVDAGTPRLTVDGQPCVVEVAHRDVRYVLVTGRSFVDLDIEVSTKDASLRRWYPQILSASLAIKCLAGEWCWQCPVVPANIIIDDPFLRPRYGFMRYDSLLAALKRCGGALTVAFIPYYWRRSSPRTVALVKEHAEHFSIAVHGCDHTRMEFGNTNYAWVAGAAATALARMRGHERHTGMPFDPIMVFPQGRFSRAAVRAAECCGYSATVNSGAWPVDREGWAMTMRDLLGMAVTRHEAFPVFTRRYPRTRFDFAFDAFFQKPILAVEHHGYFRRGYKALETFVQSISSLSPRVQWMPLGRALASTYQMRRTDGDHFVLRHLTEYLVFTNSNARPIHLEVEKPEGREVRGIRVDAGASPAFNIENGLVKYQLTVAPKQTIAVRFDYGDASLPEWPRSWRYRLRVFVRRAFSDLRDYWQYLADTMRGPRSGH